MALAIGAWTALALAGSIASIFRNPIVVGLTEQPNPHYSPAITTLLIALLFLLFFLTTAIGGAVWGIGLAMILQKPRWPLVRAGALSWSVTTLLLVLALYFSQIPLAAIDKATYFSSYDQHYLFTLVFVPAIGLAAGLNGRIMATHIGAKLIRQRIGFYSGGLAALAFLATSLFLLHVWGWQVGGPFAGWRYSMISIMNWCNFAAALAGGTVMGWLFLPYRAAMASGIEQTDAHPLTQPPGGA